MQGGFTGFATGGGRQVQVSTEAQLRARALLETSPPADTALPKRREDASVRALVETRPPADTALPKRTGDASVRALVELDRQLPGTPQLPGMKTN